MDFSAIFEYLKYADKDLGVQNPDNERKDNDGGGSDQEKIASITTDIECLQHKMQNEDERRKQLMECLDYFKNKIDDFQEFVHSFDGIKDFHEAKMNHIEKLHKVYFQKEYLTNNKTVVNLQEAEIEWPENKLKREKLNVLRNKIKVFREMIENKEKTSITKEKELVNLRAQKLILEIQTQRCAKNSSSLTDENAGMQTTLPSNNDEQISSN